MTDSKPTTANDDCPSFEDALASLEQIVRDLEEGKLGLAESLTRYESGVKLLKQCFGLLESAERRIELLTGVDAAGNPVTKPFDDEATLAGDDATSARSRRGGKTTKRAASRTEASRSAAARAESPRPAEDAEPDEPGALF